MSFSFTSMIRLLVLLALGSTMLAIGVSRLDPPRPARRFPKAVTSFNINDFFLNVPDRKSRWLESETGAMVVTPVVAGDVFEAASSSPWVDESGNRQVVGRWSSRTLQGPETVCHAFGLARYSFPEGRMINQVATDIFPVAPPCWLAGTRARILFAAGDGQLYRFAFESDDPAVVPSDLTPALDTRPAALTWKCRKPGGGEVFISEIARPTDPRMGGRFLATLRLSEPNDQGLSRFSKTQIWWLKLNSSATQIIEAGALVTHDLTGSKPLEFDERSPTVANLADGSLGLAYARQFQGQPVWSICLAKLTINADHQLVASSESQTRVVAARSLPAPLAFSTDGRWLTALVADVESSDSVVRFPTIGSAPSNSLASSRTP